MGLSARVLRGGVGNASGTYAGLRRMRSRISREEDEVEESELLSDSESEKVSMKCMRGATWDGCRDGCWDGYRRVRGTVSISSTGGLGLR